MGGHPGWGNMTRIGVGALACAAITGAAPWLSMRDLRDLDAALTAVRAGQAKAVGFYPRVFPVNDEMTLAAGFPWNNR
jgi:hypothetical protein